jgi:hypothetical protein
MEEALQELNECRIRNVQFVSRLSNADLNISETMRLLSESVCMCIDMYVCMLRSMYVETLCMYACICVRMYVRMCGGLIQHTYIHT